MKYKKDFKDILKELRIKKKVTQKEMSKNLNISLSTYSKYEQGLITPNLENILKICDFFQKDISFFLEDFTKNEEKRIDTLKKMKKISIGTNQSVTQNLKIFKKNMPLEYDRGVPVVEYLLKNGFYFDFSEKEKITIYRDEELFINNEPYILEYKLNRNDLKTILKFLENLFISSTDNIFSEFSLNDRVIKNEDPTNE